MIFEIHYIFNGTHLASATMPWQWLFFASPPNSAHILGAPVTKSLKSQKPEVALVDFGPDGRPCTCYQHFLDTLFHSTMLH